MSYLTPYRHLASSCSIIVLTAFLSAASAWGAEHSRTYDLSGFVGVSASQGIRIVVQAGKLHRIVAESDELNQIELLELDVRRGVLHAEMDHGLFSSRPAEGWRVTVFVSMPELITVSASMGSNVAADGMTGEELELSVSGGSQISVALVDGGQISVEAEGGSRISADGGSCDLLDAEASQGSSIEAEGVRCSRVSVLADSGSSVSAFAEERIEANVSSGATIRVFGTPEERELNPTSGGSIFFPE